MNFFLYENENLGRSLFDSIKRIFILKEKAAGASIF